MSVNEQVNDESDNDIKWVEQEFIFLCCSGKSPVAKL